MKDRFKTLLPAFFLLCMSVCGRAETITLEASKDNFGRSNERNQNSGGNQLLYVAHAPLVRTIIAFDLTGVTNRIVSAEFRFRRSGANPDSISLTIAPMVHTEGNAGWVEGTGALGATGRNARVGESCYGWRAFPDSEWEASSGDPVTGLGADGLWGHPFAAGKKLSWTDGDWVEVEIGNVALLEKIRVSDTPVLTLGLWGTSGNGFYAISSRESGHAPELVLEVEGQ